MRRILTIIIVISIIVLIILGIGWLMSRRTATREGAAAPSFREFITGDSGSRVDPGIDPGSLSSEFDQESTPSTSGQGSTGGSLSTGSPSINGSLSAPGTQASTFTNDTYTPGSSSTSGTTGQGGTGTTNTTPGSTTSGGGAVPPTTGGPLPPNPTSDPDPNVVVIYNPTTGSGTTGTSTPTGTGPVPGTTPPQCSEADVTIVFSPAQLAELKSLERRFYTIAESIRTDEDIAREVTNHDTFNIKGLQVLELYNTCVQKTPTLANPIYARRVPTPFWNDPNTDKGGFIVDGTDQVVPINTNNFLYGKRRLEYSLRLNLW
jgi:hypothetical protein